MHLLFLTQILIVFGIWGVLGVRGFTSLEAAAMGTVVRFRQFQSTTSDRTTLSLESAGTSTWVSME
eukprot:4729347-Amphidinium_carterae.1